MNTFNYRLIISILLAGASSMYANVVDIESANQFNDIVAAGKPVIVKVGATWCPACVRSVNPFHKLSEDANYSNVTFLNVDADKNEAVVRKYNVQSLPTFLVFNNGSSTPVKTIIGFTDREIKETLASLQSAAPVSVGEKKTEETEPALQEPAQEQADQAAVEHAPCAAEQQTFFERAYNSIRDFFVSIGNTVSGWFK